MCVRNNWIPVTEVDVFLLTLSCMSARVCVRECRTGRWCLQLGPVQMTVPATSAASASTSSALALADYSVSANDNHKWAFASPNLPAGGTSSWLDALFTGADGSRVSFISLENDCTIPAAHSSHFPAALAGSAGVDNHDPMLLFAQCACSPTAGVTISLSSIGSTCTGTTTCTGVSHAAACTAAVANTSGPATRGGRICDRVSCVISQDLLLHPVCLWCAITSLQSRVFVHMHTRVRTCACGS